jgi:hypothetical protein
MSLATKKLSRLLRTREEILEDLEAILTKVSGKRDVLSSLAEENDARVRRALDALDCPPSVSAEELHEKLMAEVTKDDRAISKLLSESNLGTVKGCESVIELAKEIVGIPRGYFLKRDIAEHLLRRNPPQNLMRELGVDSIDVLLKEYSLEAIFPAVRFAEDKQWLNDVFFRPFETLSPHDFEEREAKIIVLPEKFREIGAQFAGKKLHHISHLKELGIIFVLPVESEDHTTPPGTALEILTLVLHYLYEVSYYSNIFRRYARDPRYFSANLVSALRGDVLPAPPDEEGGKRRFLIVQRYLAKDDPSDPRLFVPHLNPEAIHWRHVEEQLEVFASTHPESGLGFWRGLDFVSEFFPLSSSREQYLARGVSEAALISFDLIDNLISHNRHSSVFTKYLYHHQEALWNEIFFAYLGRAQVEQMLEENLEKGYIEVN